MAKANQIIAIEKSVKARAHAEASELYKVIQKPELFNGFAKTYQSKNEEGDKLPEENKRVQYEVRDVLRRYERSSTDLLNTTARKDWTNTKATADVTLDEKVIIANAPVSYLLFLEKQLVDMHTFLLKLPTLDEGETWVRDADSGLNKTAVVQTHRTKKVQRPLVLFPATPEHPAQTQLVTEDIVDGYWSTMKLSGAIAKTQVQTMVERVEKLMKAVKEAREAANMTDEVESPDVGAALFNYVTAQE